MVERQRRDGSVNRTVETIVSVEKMLGYEKKDSQRGVQNSPGNKRDAVCQSKQRVTRENMYTR